MKCKLVWCSQPDRASAERAAQGFPKVWRHEQFVNNSKAMSVWFCSDKLRICHGVYCSSLTQIWASWGIVCWSCHSDLDRSLSPKDYGVTLQKVLDVNCCEHKLGIAKAWGVNWKQPLVSSGPKAEFWYGKKNGKLEDAKAYGALKSSSVLSCREFPSAALACPHSSKGSPGPVCFQVPPAL